ncbi:hypothetical protein LAZ67_9000027 [Cordylochernes scorpioides]|uniref:Uncharacterized protein n=1 Tax=Cordylochernes scorpioides TaxID=51811 RepID=A0ABY6KS45_9ARAC|nr:hypothetical protein LAZ67_9000027 [Cordylochernes scorpioides]
METSEALHWTRQQQYSIHTQDSGQCCDKDTWRHLRLFIGLDNNNKIRYKTDLTFYWTVVLKLTTSYSRTCIPAMNSFARMYRHLGMVFSNNEGNFVVSANTSKSLIRTMKKMMQRLISKALMKTEEIVIVLEHIEENMNRRPLTYASREPEDLVSLTPLMILKPHGNYTFLKGENCQKLKE